MGTALTSQTVGHFENDVTEIFGFFALDGASNVVGYQPTAAGALVATTPYSRLKGAQKALGPAGAVVLQPHTAAGVYIITLDEPFFALMAPWAQLTDQGAVNALTPYFDANVTSGSTAVIGAMPGNNPAITFQTIRLRWRTGAGALADPVASTGFWLGFTLKRSGIV